ncbi:MAG: hypothetical protein ACI398_04735 [Clostridium sp.]
MSILQKNMNIIGAILGIITAATLVGNIFGTLMPTILIGILGLILSILSIVLKNDKKWIGIAGILLNGIPLAYLAFLYLALG